MPQTRASNSGQATRGKNSGAAVRSGKPIATGKGSKDGKSVPPLPAISSAALATYRMVQAQLESQKKAAKDAEDTAIRARNRALLEAEEDASEEDVNLPARKKKKTSVTTDLSDDEEAMAAGLQSVRAAALGHQEQEDEENEAPRSAGEDENLHAELDGIDVDEVDVDMDLGCGEVDLSNEIGVEGPVENVSNTVSRKSASRSSTPKTPQPKNPSARTGNGSNTSKVVEKDFTPRTLKLALASKSHVRTRTVYDEPFPRNNKISRINFAWKTIKESAIASEDPEVHQAYKRVTKDTDVKSKLMKFTLYGRTGLVSSIISKAREKVRAYYGFSGDAEVIKKDVEWLLKDSHFVYGGINLKERTVDHLKPFGAQLIIDVIEAQWFPSTSRSKLDLETTNLIYEKRDLPLNVILLVVTAIEHALKEWSSTGRKACQITFSEDTARVSYDRHLRHWKFFESQMKAWPTWWRKTVLEQILANHSNFDINAEDNDFTGLDFSELDRLAGYEEGQQDTAIDEGEVGVVAEAGASASASVNGISESEIRVESGN